MAYFDKIPEDMMEEHSTLHTQLSNDILRRDYSWTVKKSANYTRNRQKLISLRGQRSELAYLFDKTDVMVGMTKIVYDPSTPERVYQTITGVSKKYRNLGLAKLLKANMIRHILEHYPKVETIETDGLIGNIPMMLINENLGFRRKSDRVEKEIIIEELLL